MVELKTSDHLRGRYRLSVISSVFGLKHGSGGSISSCMAADLHSFLFSVLLGAYHKRLRPCSVFIAL